jgi:hypothetical protein
MVLVIFVGGIFLGFSLGCATMAALAAREPRCQGQEGQEMGDNLTYAGSPNRQPIPSLKPRPQASGVLLTPQP